MKAITLALNCLLWIILLVEGAVLIPVGGYVVSALIAITFGSLFSVLFWSFEPLRQAMECLPTVSELGLMCVLVFIAEVVAVPIMIIMKVRDKQHEEERSTQRLNEAP